MNLSDTDQAPYSAPAPQTATVSDEAVRAAIDAYSRQMDYNDDDDDALKAAIIAVIPHLTAAVPHLALSASPCSVEAKKLPCDVQLPGAIFKRGVSISTLINALERREYWPDVLTRLPTKPVDVAAVRDGAEEFAIDKLRFRAFHTNSDADRQAYFNAVNKWFQDRHLRAISPAEPVDQWQDMVALSELSKLTYAIQHNPNCPDRYLVRLPGKAGIDLKPYGNIAFRTPNQTNDILGFGKTLHEAYIAATAALNPSEPRT